jgi:hypothetical protein
MKTSKRFPSLLVAAIPLAAFVLAGPGCGKREPSDKGFRGPNTVVAVVTYKDGAPSARMTVSPSSPEDPKLIRLSESAGDKVWWLSPAGKIHIKWTGKRPFDKDPVDEDGVVKSDRPSRGTAGQRFPYAAELVLPGGNTVKIDPIIEVME